MDKRRENDIRKLIGKAGLICDRLFVTGSNHCAGRLRNSEGMTRQFIFSGSPSCSRGDLNKLSDMRRFSAEHRVT